MLLDQRARRLVDFGNVVLLEDEGLEDEVRAQDYVREDFEGAEGRHEEQEEDDDVGHALDVLDVGAVVLSLGPTSQRMSTSWASFTTCGNCWWLKK